MRRRAATPPRPDGPRPAPARRDPVLLLVIAIGVLSIVLAVVVSVATPTPTVQHARPTPTSPSPTATASRSPSPAEVPTGPHGSYAFLGVTYVDGERVPIRWNPCQPIEYEIEYQVRPRGAGDAIRAAIDQTSSATGIAFRSDGLTDVSPRKVLSGGFLVDPLGSVYRPVLIAVVTHRVFRSFAPSKRALAFAHPERGTQRLDDQYVSGAVVVDGGVRYASGGRWSLGLVVQHELGHLVGLAHVSAPDELMFSVEEARNTIPDPISGWGAGDLRGLELVGADQGCLEPVNVRG
jgi:Matrixin